MKHSTSYNHLVRLQGKLDSIYSAAESYCSPHEEILARLKEHVWEDKALAKCPGWVRQCLSERASARLDFIQRHLIIWMFETSPGVATTWDNLDEKTRASYCWSNKKGEHYWLRAKYAGKPNCSTGDTLTREFEVTSHKF